MAEYPGSTSRDYTFVSGVAGAASQTKTIVAVAGQHVCIQRIDFSCASDGAHTLTIKEDDEGDASYTNREWKVHVTKGGPGPIVGGETPVYIGNKGCGVQIILTASTGNCTLNVLYY